MLTYFVIVFETFDTEPLVRSLRTIEPSGVIVVWNYAGEIKIVECPERIGLRRHYRFFKTGNWTENRFVKWPRLLLTLGWIMTRILTAERVARFFVTGGDVLLWFAQLFKRLGRIQKTITTLEDWSLPIPQDTFFDRFNKRKLLFNDFILNQLDTTVLVMPKQIYDLRDTYWNGRTRSNSVLQEGKWAWFLGPRPRGPRTRRGSSIALLGTVRENFGMDILLEILPRLHRELGMRLKVIGLESALYRHFKTKADAGPARDCIEWCGYVELADLPDALEDCFCGLNLQDLAENNSAAVVPGRVVHYLQEMVVPVVTPYSGAIVQILRQHQMGVICNADRDSIYAGIVDAHREHSRLVCGIEKFLSENPYGVSARDLLRI